MSDSLSVQVGGLHYKNLGIQPVEFGMVNRYDPCAFSTLKYVTRHRAKHGKEDLLKGRHFVQLRRDILIREPETRFAVALNVIDIREYCQSNGLPFMETAILCDLHLWALGQAGLRPHVIADFLIQKIDKLIEDTYPEKAE